MRSSLWPVIVLLIAACQIAQKKQNPEPGDSDQESDADEPIDDDDVTDPNGDSDDDSDPSGDSDADADDGDADADTDGDADDDSVDGSPWPMFRGTAQHTGESPFVGPKTATIKWTYAYADANATHGQYPKNIVLDSAGRLYTNANRKLVALDTDNGALLWSVTGLAGGGGVALSADETVLYVVADKTLLAYTTGLGGGASGELLWSFSEANKTIYAEPTVASDGAIYLGSFDTHVYAVNDDGTLKWTFDCAGGIAPLAAPTLSNDETIVYVGSGDPNADKPVSQGGTGESGGTVYALDATSGAELDSYKLDQIRVSGIVVAPDDTLYVNAMGRTYHLTSALTKIWESADGTAGSLCPGFYDGSITYNSKTYSGVVFDGTAQNGKVYALSASTSPAGGSIWSYQTGENPDYDPQNPKEPQYGVVTAPLIGSDGVLYIGSFDRNMHAIATDGSKLWAYEAGKTIDENGPAMGPDGTLYFSAHDSVIYAIRDGGADDNQSNTNENNSSNTDNNSSNTNENNSSADNNGTLGAFTGKYMLTFHACDANTTTCTDPQNHKVYLTTCSANAIADCNGSAWDLVPGWTAYAGSVPDLVRRTDSVYIYTANSQLRRINVASGAMTTSQVSVKTATNQDVYYVDPAPILDGSALVLFFLYCVDGSGNPTQCFGNPQVANPSHRIGAATEVADSNGTSFTLVDTTQVDCAADSEITDCTDPDVFYDGTKYRLYVAVGAKVRMYESSTLKGAYVTPSWLVPGASNNSGTVPSGYYDGSAHWIFGHGGSGGASTLRRASFDPANTQQISSDAWSTMLTATDVGLSATTSIESPGFALLE